MSTWKTPKRSTFTTLDSDVPTAHISPHYHNTWLSSSQPHCVSQLHPAVVEAENLPPKYMLSDIQEQEIENYEQSNFYTPRVGNHRMPFRSVRNSPNYQYGNSYDCREQEIKFGPLRGHVTFEDERSPSSRINHVGYDSTDISYVDVLKKLGATEYEIRELKRKVSEMRNELLEKDSEKATKQKEIDDLKFKWDEDSTEKQILVDKIDKMKDYLKKLPTVDEANEIKSKMTIFRENIRTLEDSNETLKETVVFYKKEIKKKNDQLSDKEEMLKKSEAKYLELEEKFEKYRVDIKSLLGDDDRINIEDVLNDLERLKNDSLNLRKLVMVKQKQVENGRTDTQKVIHSLESKLAKSQDHVCNLQKEILNNANIIEDLKRQLHESSSNYENLCDKMNILQRKFDSVYKAVEDSTCEEKIKEALSKEMFLCFEELSNLLKAYTDYAEEKEPNISLLLSSRGLSSDEILSSNESTCAEKLKEMKKLRNKVSETQNKMSDKYVESLSKNCIMQ